MSKTRSIILVQLCMIFLLPISSCSGSPQNQETMENDKDEYTNELIHETSPYLLQHAHNPVNWQPWGEKALKQAVEEDKMILVSIGYSACHWCHVMERESFEDEEVAAYMNEHFICIKVDREERPDVDQVYMDAVQYMSGRGGWPLNCFTTPDARPFYGGTYFPKKNWLYLLQNLVKEYTENREKVEIYAEDLTNGIKGNEVVELNKDSSDYENTLTEMIKAWRPKLDNKEGGPNRAPKFPLPNNYDFLLDYAIMNNDRAMLDHVKLTLDKMAYGGIYDQLMGGFARYSTDMDWKVPHFEKMLYDNAQLVSLYAKAFRYFKDYEYLNVMINTLEFIKQEMTGPDGEFYSALDADTEGEEGRYYVWTEDELTGIKDLNVDLIRNYYNAKPENAWEGNYVLHRKKEDKDVARELGYDESEEGLGNFHKDLMMAKSRLISSRMMREKPGLDDKSLTSWNALMISGYANAYKADNNYEYRYNAVKAADFIWNKQRKKDGSLYHSYKKGVSTIDGFLEDYAMTAQAFLDVYEIEFDNKWIERADKICQYAIDHFFDEEKKMFYFISDSQKDLIARKMELNDNVIPASNSVMANVLFRIGTMLDKNEWVEIANQMLLNVSPYMASYGSAYSNWAILMNTKLFPFYEVVVCGEDYRQITEKVYDNYKPNTLFIASSEDKDVPLLENKLVKEKTLIYVCVNKSCQLPVEKPEEAHKQITYPN
jgi:uncharacterized protein YyaL (SSP411 family)